jgi:hypothetical protein
MAFADAYLAKAGVDLIPDNPPPSKDLAIVVAIPANREPDIIATLFSLLQNRRPAEAVEVYVLINAAESAGKDVLACNRQTEEAVLDFSRKHSTREFRILVSNVSGIPDREAGAGLARKMAMDFALSRFNRVDQSGGVLLSLDADTLCDPNYLTEVARQFREKPDTKGCSIRFEHPVEGSSFPAQVYQGIIQYELHLRYYIQALRFAGHPHAYHTIGSAFGVRADVYAAQGGMSKKKAGEDFYFLQKIIPLGGYYEINGTRVRPSPRPSDRVGFGTGPVIRKFQCGETTRFFTYHPAVFSELKSLLSMVPSLYHAGEPLLGRILDGFPSSLQENLRHEFIPRMLEIRRNSARQSTFINRFYRWFNMFRTMKYINYAHLHHYDRMPVRDAAMEFISGNFPKYTGTGSARDLLFLLRDIQGEKGLIPPQ